MLARALALSLALGCRPTTSTAPGDVDARATPVDGARPRRDDAFLRLDADLAASYPLRARLVRAGLVYAQHDGTPTGVGENRTIALVVTVVDPDTHGDPTRPRVLCEGTGYRVAVYVDVDDLAIVARTGAVMAHTPQLRDDWPDTMPGVRLASGTPLRIEGGQGGDFVRAVLETPSLRASGFIDRTHVGYTWVPGELPAAVGLADARVREPASLLGVPLGPELARLDPRMAPSGLFVRRLGPEQAGHVLVRHDAAELSAVGWIDATQLELHPGAATSSVRMVGRGGGEASEPTRELARGTVLLGGALRDPIGVVTETTRMHCLEACDTDAPRVLVPACTAAIPVWTKPP